MTMTEVAAAETRLGGVLSGYVQGKPPESTPRARATQRSDTPTAWCLAPPRHMGRASTALQHVAAGHRSGPAPTSGGAAPASYPGPLRHEGRTLELQIPGQVS